MHRSSWTEKQTNTLIKEYPVISDTRDLTKLIGKSYLAIRSRARFLKLKRVARSSKFGRTKASPKDDQFIRDHFLTMPVNAIAQKLKYSEMLVKGRMKFLKLEVPEETRQEFKRLNMFRKGQAPPNKGKRQKDFMSKEGIRKSATTRFKKGFLPHNTLQDGVITTRIDTKTQRPYKYIRLSLGKWQPLHVYKWEKKYGKVPRGMCIRFKDGDSLNVTLRNLALISRKENVIQNSGSIRLTDGMVARYIVGKSGNDLYNEVLRDKKLIEAKRQQLILKRTIDELNSHPEKA